MARKLRPIGLPDGHPPVAFGRIGVLLVNLGTPDATDFWSMRRYLKEFLSDRRVIEVNRAVWWFVLNFIVLTRRPKSSGAAYRQIWNTELDESPLRTITRSQSGLLAAKFSSDPRMEIDWAMRYGSPSIRDKLNALREKGCERILIFPLYPQYSAATTATVCDKVFDALKEMRWQPSVRIVPPYYDNPVYIDALAASLRHHLKSLAWKPDAVITSYHGLPQEYFDKGDPYHCHCQKTTRLLGEKLGRLGKLLQVTFQSRFGKAEWLKPYTDKTIEDLARSGTGSLAVMMPGFASDCVETLEEIAGENAAIFRENGGTNFTAVPCLNDSPEGIAVLHAIVENELKGWL